MKNSSLTVSVSKRLKNINRDINRGRVLVLHVLNVIISVSKTCVFFDNNGTYVLHKKTSSFVRPSCDGLHCERITS